MCAAAVLTGGFKLIRHAGELKFYNNFLLRWEDAMSHLSVSDSTLPEFNGTNHVRYMDKLVRLMQNSNIQVPVSNTDRAYVYQVPGAGISSRQDIFILCFEKKIVLFGLSKRMFNMLDKRIDHQLGRTNGKFTGRKQEHTAVHTGIWRL